MAEVKQPVEKFVEGEFKGIKGHQKVFIRTLDGAIVVTEGKITMRYTKDPTAKLYTPAASKVTMADGKSIDKCKQVAGVPEKVKPNYSGMGTGKVSAKPTPNPSNVKVAKDCTTAAELVASFGTNAIICYTDGACEGNPGPCGAGAVVCLPGVKTRLEEWQALGQGTNNIGELTAVVLAFDILDKMEAKREKGKFKNDIHIMTDSTYTEGMLVKNWKAKKNIELVAKLKAKLADRRKTNKVSLHWVKAHVGIPDNERADQLAKQGVAACKGVMSRKRKTAPAVAADDGTNEPVLKFRGSTDASAL